jgi:hypothetical protein
VSSSRFFGSTSSPSRSRLLYVAVRLQQCSAAAHAQVLLFCMSSSSGQASATPSSRRSDRSAQHLLRPPLCPRLRARSSIPDAKDCVPHHLRASAFPCCQVLRRFYPSLSARKRRPALHQSVGLRRVVPAVVVMAATTPVARVPVHAIAYLVFLAGSHSSSTTSRSAHAHLNGTPFWVHFGQGRPGPAPHFSKPLVEPLCCQE